MYYPSFFASVRPYQTLHARERVDNPLDLSVKQAVSRAEGPCGPDHQDIQLMMEQRITSRSSLAQQMPLMDSIYGYKTFGSDSQSCQMPGTSTSLLSQSLSTPYCTSGSSGPGLNHLGIIPCLLQPNRDSLGVEAPPPPLTPFSIDPSAIPYHMRINSAAAAAMALNNANQRAYYGSSTVLSPHITGSFAATLPHISLYSDLLNDMSRRPVEPEKGVFTTLSSIRSPAEPTTRFSDHLQRLREQHIQQSKCSGPCCLPSVGHGSHGPSGQHSHSHSIAGCVTNACNCCVIPMAMSGNVSALIMPSSVSIVGSHTAVPVSVSMSCKDACDRDIIANNSGDNASNNNSLNNNDNNNNSNFNDNPCNKNCKPRELRDSYDAQHRSHLHNESQTMQKQDMKYVSSLHCHSTHTTPHLWNPSLTNNPPLTDYHNNHKQTVTYSRSESTEEESAKCGTITAKLVNDRKNNNSINTNVLCESRSSNADIFITKETICSNQSVSNKMIKSLAKRENAISQKDVHSSSCSEVITIEEDCIEANAQNTGLNNDRSRSASPRPTLSNKQNDQNVYNHNENNIISCSASVATDMIPTNNITTHMLLNTISTTTTTTTATDTTVPMAFNNNNCFNQTNVSMETTKSPQARGEQNEVQLNTDGSVDGKTDSGKSSADSAHSCMNTEIDQKQAQQTVAEKQQNKTIKLSQLKSYFGGNTSALRQQNDHRMHSEPTQKTREESAIGIEMKTKAKSSNITKQLKDYKFVAKNANINAIDKNKRQPKETKTVEVQCDGPDWTPIVLPVQLKNKLRRAVRRKISCNESKNNNTTKQLIDHKKESKKRKKCKQKHSHRSHSRSRSSSSSSISSRRSSPERNRHLSHHCDAATGKSRKRSMLQCLVNSEGYVADKIKKTSREHNLFVSDPSQLGREERALQRAIKHFGDQQNPCNSDKTVKNSAENFPVPQNNFNPNNTGGDQLEKHKHNRKHQKVTDTNDIIIKNKKQDSLKWNKASNKCIDNTDCVQLFENRDSLESNEKCNAKAEQKLRLLENILKDKCEDDVQAQVKCREKHTLNKKSDNNNENKSKDTEIIKTKQKKPISCVRRRRFRSGLDMIRHPHRRKKTRPNHIHGSNAAQESSNQSGCENGHKSNSESGNASLPTEMKRLMVNKALGETLLHRAARSNRKDVVKYCLQSNTCDVNARDNANYTPLHECSTRGNLEIARSLLQHSADVNASAAGGIRPLHDAVENNHIELVRLLLSYGADPNISTYSGSTPLSLARSKAMVQFLKGFLSDISGDNQLEDSNEKVLPWKFNGSASFLDTGTGFNALDGLLSDGDEEESDDFLFEVSDTPLDPTYRLPNSRTKGSSNFLCLSDILRRTCLTKEEFVRKHSKVEILTIGKCELEKTISQLLVRSGLEQFHDDRYTVDVVHLDDYIRTILGIETVTLR